MQAAAFAGAVGGTTMTDDVVNGFMDRLMLSARKRMAIVAGYVVAMLVRATIATLVLTGVAFALGMKVKGSPLELLGLYGLAVLLNLTASLWSGGIHAHSVPERAAARDPANLLALFLTPVFLPFHLLHGWLHAVATGNPFTRPLEAGRSLIAGTPSGVAVAYAVVGEWQLPRHSSPPGESDGRRRDDRDPDRSRGRRH